LSAGIQAVKGDGSFSTGFEEFIKEAAKVSSVTFRFYGRGGPGLQGLSGIINNVEDLNAVRAEIAKYVQGLSEKNAAPVEYQASSFSGFGVDLSSPVVDVEEQKLRDLMYVYYSTEQTLKKINAIIANRDTTYSYIDELVYRKFQSARVTYKEFLETIRKLSSDLQQKPGSVVVPEPLDTQLPWPSPNMGLSIRPTDGGTVLQGFVEDGRLASLAIVKDGQVIMDLPIQNHFYEELARLGMPTIPNDLGQSEGIFDIPRRYNVKWVLAGNRGDLEGAEAQAKSKRGVVFARCRLVRLPY
jgi:hypothetical protein